MKIIYSDKFQRFSVCMMASSPIQSLRIIARPLKLSPSINLERFTNKVSPTSKGGVLTSRSSTLKINGITSPVSILNNENDKGANSRLQCAAFSESPKYKRKRYYIERRKATIGCCISPGDISFDTPDRSKLSQHSCENEKEYNLGNGAFGFVLRGNYKGERIAVKLVPKHKMSSLRNEENGLKLVHPNIIRMFKVIIENEFGLVFMERNFGLNVQELLHEMCISLKAAERLRYMLNIAHALLYCHNMGILHLDVKPKNILLNISKNICKLCDFGCSSQIVEMKHYPENENFGVNTVWYTDPQLLRGKLPSEKSDVYSFGITMWQLMSQEMPYEGLESHTIIFKVVSEDHRPKPIHSLSSNDREYIKLYESCWQSEPDMRPNMSCIVEQLEKLLLRH